MAVSPPVGEGEISSSTQNLNDTAEPWLAIA